MFTHHHFSSAEFCPWKLSTLERTFTMCPSLPWGQFNKTLTSVVHNYIALVLQSGNNIVATVKGLNPGVISKVS